MTKRRTHLLKPGEVDIIFKYPAGRTRRLAKAGKIDFIVLPDGDIRIPESAINEIVHGGNDE